MNKYITKASMLSVVAAVVLGTAGCGGGGGGSTPPPSSGTTSASGKAVEGYLSGATVCFDMNINDACDPTEPFKITDANGDFNLTITDAQKKAAKPNAPILVQGGTDIDNNKRLVGVLKAPYADTTTTINVTPLTTMVASMVAKGTPVDTAYATVGKAFGLSAAQVQADPIENNNSKAIKAAMSIDRIVTMMATDANVTKDSIYGALVTGIQQVADDNTSTKGIASIVTKAANDTNSTLPPKAKQTTKVAKTIEDQISNALDTHPGDRQAAALVSDEVVNVVQTTIKTKLDNNESLSDTDIADIDNNATATAQSAANDLIKIAIKNILDSYHIDYTDTDISNLEAALPNTLSEINIDKVSALTGLTDSHTQAIVNALALANKKAQIDIYAKKLEITLTDAQITTIATTSATPAFSKAMTTADFAKLLYNTGDATLMKISLELTNPSVLNSIDKAKKLFTDLRTQTTSIQNFNTTQTQGIDAAINKVALNADFDSFIFNMLNNGITYAMDTNQSTLQGSLNAQRDIKLTKGNTSGGNVVWNYDINSSTQTWSGKITYTDVNPTTFDPANFSKLHANLTGTLPLDYTAVTTAGVTDSQDINLDANVSKITGGANITMNASISSNGDAITLTNLDADAFYDVNATDVTPKYVKVNKLHVNGTVGQYSVNGALDINTYTQNKLFATKKFMQTITNVYLGVQCVNSTFDYANASITLNGKAYAPSLSSEYSYQHVPAGGGTTRTIHDYDLHIPNVDGALQYNDFQTAVTNANLKCSDGSSVSLRYSNVWDDGKTLYNSGYLPSNVTFKGTVKDNSSNILEATLNVQWTNAADMNISDSNATPSIAATLNGKLTRSASPVTNVSIKYNGTSSNQDINATYAYDTTAITTDATFDTDLKNGTIKISSASGIKANIKIVNKTIDYTNSTLKDTNNVTIGNFEERSGVPVIKYTDGTFESLP